MSLINERTGTGLFTLFWALLAAAGAVAAATGYVHGWLAFAIGCVMVVITASAARPWPLFRRPIVLTSVVMGSLLAVLAILTLAGVIST